MISVCDKLSIIIIKLYIPSITYVASNFCYDFTIVLPVDCAIKSGPRGCGKLTHNYTPRFNEVDRGVYWYHLGRLSVCPSVHLSVCGQNRVRSVSSTILIRSISYLHILSLKFWRIFKICNFDFVIFWLWIQYDSMVWVIMRRRGVSSERRRSSCSSLFHH